MYTIISKIELEGVDSLKFTDYGTATDPEVINQINEDYDSTLGKFLGENRTKLEIGEVLISSFFETTPAVYEARIVVDNIEEFNLLPITNFNELF